ncbi:unnamed protein product [Macrosiphum euphorbiae]|uniref:Uncharacterized protein n=1 Tax=Macrosiphum euphorbiae TaxID=13131 RepID=A0AAV0XFX6_9HEMI|nr:unnamed protein product [Macrosiphum euphorbiae]
MACQCRRNLPRQENLYVDVGEGALLNSKRTCLTQADLAIRSRQVYYTLVTNPGLKSHLKSMPEWKKKGLRLNMLFPNLLVLNMSSLNLIGPLRPHLRTSFPVGVNFFYTDTPLF